MPKLVVIGGGFAGTCIARSLLGAMEVTLVDTKEFFEFTPGVLRALVRWHHVSSIQSSHASYLGQARVVVGNVDRIGSASVHLADGQELHFDYLAVATGSRYAAPIKDSSVVLATRADELHRYYHRLESAQRILIIGGGLVGVELAAEIVARYPGKHVTVAHAGVELLERNMPSVRRYATRFLQRRGVEILYGQMVVKMEGDQFVTNQGRSLPADLAFMCTGVVPNSEAVGASFPGSLDSHGFVHVQPTLQLPGHPNIFVAGDANDCGVEKTAQNAQRQAAVAAANILALAGGKPLRSYDPRPTPMVISLGPSCGIFTSRRLTITGTIPALMKWFIERREMLARR